MNQVCLQVFTLRHEHLYSKISKNLIRSDDFSNKGLHKALNGVRVILCTLSMLSNSRLASISHVNPVTTLVIDEASQIEVGDYVAVFTTYVSSLRKLCFIGDDKQCESLFNIWSLRVLTRFLVPPYGQENNENLRSIFEVAHLRDSAIFLDTQCKLCFF